MKKIDIQEVFRRIRQMHDRPDEQADICTEGLKLLVAMVKERTQTTQEAT